MSLSITDYVIQGVMVLSVLLLPFILRPGPGTRSFGYPFMIIFVWGIWRMAYFDPATNNDIPGMGYFVCAFIYALIGRGLFAVRCAIHRWKNKRREGGSDGAGRYAFETPKIQ